MLTLIIETTKKINEDKMGFYELGDAQYINLETFKRDGSSVKTPVWVAKENGKLYVWTLAQSWKVKRIKNIEDVNLCQSDARGTPQSEWIAAKAKILSTPEEMQRLRKLMTAKYGMMFRIFALFGRLRGSKREDYISVEIRPAA